MREKIRVIEGWWLTLCLAISIAIVFSLILFSVAGDEGIRLALRTTARISFTLFSLAFAASALYHLWPGEWTAWLLRNRRYVGVSFAVCHTFHLLAILILAHQDPARFMQQTRGFVLIGGGIAFAFIFAMTATSFDRTASWLGGRKWKVLHRTGMYYIWAIFFFDFIQLAAKSLFYAPFAFIVLLLPFLRLIARRSNANVRQTLQEIP